jgi:site-specific DNA recombinase
MIAAVYARKSTEQQHVADDQKSVARQIEHARVYAARKGWTIADAHVYVDDGISGAEFAHRPGFLRLMNALKPTPAFQVLVMSEESRLGRETIETAYALKQIVTAGVRVFFYLDDRERALDSPTDKIMLSLTAFADELEREKARQRTYDAMLRKARAGHVTGGRTFGYDNVEVVGPGGTRSHVTYCINEAEAAIVRRIFERAAAGDGLKTITKRLNAERAPSPRPQQGRPQGWAPSSVREVLYRELYRGRRIWNKTKKRDIWGQDRRRDRPASEWLTLDAEGLRIVPEALWHAVHERLRQRRAIYLGFKAGQRSDCRDGRGVRRHYFLTGFSRCAACGGSMQAVSRASSAGRVFRYVCATYWNRGASVCHNGRMARMPVADRAIHRLLATEVLRPAVIERALGDAIDTLRRDGDVQPRCDRLRRDVAHIETELANLTETAARSGAVPTVLEALTRREEERRRLMHELAALDAKRPARLDRPVELRTRLNGFLADWSGLLTENVSEARPLLDLVLADRIAFRPLPKNRYELTVPIAFDRLLTVVIPELQDRVVSGAKLASADRANCRDDRALQDRMASPRGYEEGRQLKPATFVVGIAA